MRNNQLKFKTLGKLSITLEESRECILYYQTASHKSALPYYYPTHMANSCQSSDQGRTLAQFRDHFKSTLAYNWTPLEEQVSNIRETQYICGRCQLATTTWLISYIIPQRKANKRKLKDINMQPIGLGNTSMLRFCPKSPLNIAPHYHETKSKLILKSGKPKRLIRLKVHQDGFKTSNSQ